MLVNEIMQKLQHTTGMWSTVIKDLYSCITVHTSRALLESKRHLLPLQ